MTAKNGQQYNEDVVRKKIYDFLNGPYSPQRPIIDPDSLANKAFVRDEDISEAPGYPENYGHHVEAFIDGKLSIEELEKFYEESKSTPTAGGREAGGKFSFLKRCKETFGKIMKCLNEQHNNSPSAKLAVKPVYFTATRTDHKEY